MVSQGTVLVIDDDRDFLEFVRIILESNGYHVYTAEEADEGMRLAQQMQPDIVLVDVMISFVLDGLNLIESLRADPQCCSIPIVLVSAIISTERDSLLPPGQELVCDAFMPKPVEPQALVDTIAELIALSCA